MKTISIMNHKGGTGKTTSSINIGAGLAKKGFKVLLLDIDSQANLTEGLGKGDP
ncbi:MAG TPA: chromosome partitioning protein ParA, partial [Algoriphagus sp.]|nr:chromosome partitioning protein ParA [Algoriphagus sp.]